MTAVADTGNNRGRRGVGATSHCAHGNWSSLTEYTDWRPFEYFSVKRSITSASFMAAPPATETVEFVAADGGTDVRFRIEVRRPLRTDQGARHGLAGAEDVRGPGGAPEPDPRA